MVTAPNKNGRVKEKQRIMKEQVDDKLKVIDVFVGKVEELEKRVDVLENKLKAKNKKAAKDEQ